MSPLILARFCPKSGAEAHVESLLRSMVTSTRLEPGCRRYDLFRTSSPGGTVFCLIEQYADEQALAAHRETPHYKSYRARITDLLAQPIDVSHLEAIDARDGSP